MKIVITKKHVLAGEPHSIELADLQFVHPEKETIEDTKVVTDNNLITSLKSINNGTTVIMPEEGQDIIPCLTATAIGTEEELNTVKELVQYHWETVLDGNKALEFFIVAPGTIREYNISIDANFKSQYEKGMGYMVMGILDVDDESDCVKSTFDETITKALVSAYELVNSGASTVGILPIKTLVDIGIENIEEMMEKGQTIEELGGTGFYTKNGISLLPELPSLIGSSLFSVRKDIFLTLIEMLKDVVGDDDSSTITEVLQCFYAIFIKTMDLSKSGAIAQCHSKADEEDTTKYTN